MVKNKVKMNSRFPKYFSEKYLNPVLQLFSWHTNIYPIQKMLDMPLMHIQAINPLIFREQTLDVFLRGLFVVY